MPAQSVEQRRQDRDAAGGYHDALGMDRLTLRRHQGVGTRETDFFRQTVGWCNGLNRFQHEADKTVAFLLHSGHHCRPVHRQTFHMHPEPISMERLMRGLGCSNQQFAGHATEAGAGRAVIAAFDQQDRVGVGAGGPVGSHPRSTGANDGDIDMDGVHESELISTTR